MDDRLEQRLREAEAKLPNLREHLKPYSGGFFDEYYNVRIDDATYLETNNYNVVVANMNEHSWSDCGGGISWSVWLSVHYRGKKDEKEIILLETEKIRIRSREGSAGDKRHLWGYSFVFAQHTSEDQIEVAWANEEGDKALTYRINLGENIVERIDNINLSPPRKLPSWL